MLSSSYTEVDLSPTPKAISPGPGPISPTWNPSTRGLRYVWPRTFWDPDPAPRSPRIQHGSNPEDGDSETAKITAKLSPPSSRYVHHVHARCILHHAGTHSAMRRHLSSESNQRQRAIRTFTDGEQVKLERYKVRLKAQLKVNYGQLGMYTTANG